MMTEQLAHDLNPWWQDPATRASRHPFRRPVIHELIRQLGSLDRAVAMVGLRQVGKTALLRQMVDWARFEASPPLPAANVTYFDFQDDRAAGQVTPRDLLALQPLGFREDLPRLVLFDEITSFPGWDVWLKTTVDRQRHDPGGSPIRFIVTDSSASLLRAGGTESGLGRWTEVLVEPLDFREFLALRYGTGRSPREQFTERPESFDAFLSTGGFPETARNLALDAGQVRRTIREDIAGRAIEKDLIRHGLDSRARDLFVSLAQSSGAQFGLEARARDLGATVNTILRWLEVLKNAGLVVPLARWQSGAKSTPTGWRNTKLYVADHGMVSAFAAQPDPLASPRVRGCAYETLACQTLRAATRELDGTLRYGRFGDKLEVDFVLETGSLRTVIEVTGGGTPRDRKWKTLLEAGDRVAATRMLLLHGGATTKSEANRLALPMHEFLLDPMEHLH